MTAVLLGGAATASATVGSGISAAPVTLGAKKAMPGRSYEVRFLVQNTGDVRTRYTLLVERFGGAKGRAVPSTWVTFRPRRPWLNAGQLMTIRARIAIPRKARPAAYVGLITLAAGVPGRAGSGVTPRVGASTRLSFRVVPRPNPTRREDR